MSACNDIITLALLSSGIRTPAGKERGYAMELWWDESDMAHGKTN